MGNKFGNLAEQLSGLMREITRKLAGNMDFSEADPDELRLLVFAAKAYLKFNHRKGLNSEAEGYRGDAQKKLEWLKERLEKNKDNSREKELRREVFSHYALLPHSVLRQMPDKLKRWAYKESNAYLMNLLK